MWTTAREFQINSFPNFRRTSSFITLHRLGQQLFLSKGGGGIKYKTKMSVRPRHKERVRFPSNKQVPADAALHPLAARLF